MRVGRYCGGEEVVPGYNLPYLSQRDLTWAGWDIDEHEESFGRLIDRFLTGTTHPSDKPKVISDICINPVTAIYIAATCSNSFKRREALRLMKKLERIDRRRHIQPD